MRSLYVDDIDGKYLLQLGTKPKKSIYTKNMFKQKHDEEIRRHAKKSEEKRNIQWYLPMKKSQQFLERKQQDIWKTKKSLLYGSSAFKNSSFLNGSKHQQSQKKNQFDEKLSKSTVLTGTAQNILSSSKVSRDPYFPHYYTEANSKQINLLSGNRSWVEQPSNHIILPKKQSLFPRMK